MPEMGLEPIRLAPHDFESCVYTIPPLRQWVAVYQMSNIKESDIFSFFCYTPLTMKPKVLAIVGPTASGKTSLSIELAKHFNGEVISVDSRQVYRGIDLCSGKVTKEEMSGVPHHLLDVVDLTDTYTAADFTRDAAAALLTIQNRGRLPILVGGTFFYLNALLGRTSTPAVPPNATLRAELEALPPETLHKRLVLLDPARAASIDQKNPRRLVRAIEVATALGAVPPVSTTEPYDVLTLGIQLDRQSLHHNIHTRIIDRLEAGMVAEVEALLAQGVTHERLESLGLECRYLSRYLRGELTYEAAIADLEIKTRQFAKRQMTWLKRDATIHWVEQQDKKQIIDSVSSFLNAER